MTFTFLWDLKKFLQREVCDKIQLKRPDVDDVMHFTLVPPKVHIGWPQTQEAGRDHRQRVPGIVIGLSGAIIDDGEWCTIPIQLVAIVHSAGTILPNDVLAVDDTGYVDLLNLMDVTVRAICNADHFGAGLTLAEIPVQYQPDNERYYDYWIGHIDFTIQAPSRPRTAERDLI